MELSMPETITINKESLIYLWVVLHLVYAAVTHYHWVCQTNKLVKEQNKANQRQVAVSTGDLVGGGLWRLFVGLEAKILEVLAYCIVKVLGFGLSLRNVKLWKLSWHVSPNATTVRVTQPADD